MKTKLAKGWMPPENVLTLARAKGMPIEDWLYHLLPEWRLYWIDSGLMKSSWGSTFWNWAKKQWKLVDKSRLPIDPKVLDMAKKIGVIEYTDTTEEGDDLLAKQRFYPEKRKVMPAPKPGKIDYFKIKKAVKMTVEKRIEFADYLNNNCK